MNSKFAVNDKVVMAVNESEGGPVKGTKGIVKAIYPSYILPVLVSFEWKDGHQASGFLKGEEANTGWFCNPEWLSHQSEEPLPEAKPEGLKKGDWVVVVDNKGYEQRLPLGTKGKVVIAEGGFMLGVQFKNWNNGHALGIGIKANSGFWCLDWRLAKTTRPYKKRAHKPTQVELLTAEVERLKAALAEVKTAVEGL